MAESRKPVISVHDLAKNYGELKVLRKIDMDIYKGEVVSVIGPSGSGKSTFLRCLNYLEELTSGEIDIGGVSLKGIDEDKHNKKLNEKAAKVIRKNVGMVFQQFALYPHLTVLDNAAYALKIAGVPREARRARAREVLALVGLADYAEHFPDQLSGGMRQRVGIARALAADPEIIIMDEALSALDPLIRREMQNEIRALQKKLGKTVIFITHDLDEAIRLADRVLIMKDGEIAQLGTMEEILSRPANAYVEKFVNAADKTKVITAGSIMKPVYDYLRLGDGPQTMLHKIRESGLSSLFATNDQGVIYGLVWARKVREHMNEPNVTAQSMMDTNIKTVNRSAPLKEVVMQMGESTAPIAVVDDERRFLGVITSGALLACLASYNGTTGEIK